jgi:hypothetical protein
MQTREPSALLAWACSWRRVRYCIALRVEIIRCHEPVASSVGEAARGLLLISIDVASRGRRNTNELRFSSGW